MPPMLVQSMSFLILIPLVLFKTSLLLPVEVRLLLRVMFISSLWAFLFVVFLSFSRELLTRNTVRRNVFINYLRSPSFKTCMAKYNVNSVSYWRDLHYWKSSYSFLTMGHHHFSCAVHRSCQRVAPGELLAPNVSHFKATQLGNWHLVAIFI